MAEIVVDSQARKFVQTQIVDWWSEDDHNFPWRAPDEEWRLLVTEVLLQRTRAETVADERNVFFARFNSPASLGDASEEEVAEAIYSLGLAWRAKYLRELGAALAKTDGVVPDSTDEIRELPGVGPYVAGAFQALHRNKHASFVDANVVRLLARFFGFEKDGETRRNAGSSSWSNSSSTTTMSRARSATPYSISRGRSARARRIARNVRCVSSVRSGKTLCLNECFWGAKVVAG